jgi:glycosyltransferase involved in cell wall biosynthesis
MKLSIVIPVYNEEKTIAEVISEVSAVVIPSVVKEIIVVNDASSDTTGEILQKVKKSFKDLVVVTHEKNKGKGAAVRTGFAKATGDYIVIQDADMEYDPQYFKKLVQPIIVGKTEVVYGTRLKQLPNLAKHGTMGKGRFLLHFFGNRFLSLVTSILYLQWITDMETCYKIFPKKFLSTTTLKGNGFNFEPEITAKLIKAGYHIVEIPITTKPRGYNEGKKLQTIPEGIEAIKTLFKYRFSK